VEIQEGNPDISLSSDILQLFLGDPMTFPGQTGKYDLSSMFLVCPGASSQLDVSKNLQREVTRTHPNQMPEPLL